MVIALSFGIVLVQRVWTYFCDLLAEVNVFTVQYSE